jgi:Spy/CpxP family protein refolding chaperone
MKTKVLLMIGLMGFASVLLAQPAQRPVRNGEGLQRSQMMARQRAQKPETAFKLTDAQKEEFKKGMLALHKQMQPLKNQLGEAAAHQKTLMTAEKTDLAAIDKNLDKIGAIKTEMAKLQAKSRLEMRAQLTDEQKLMFDMHKGAMKQKTGKMQMRFHQPKPKPMN